MFDFGILQEFAGVIIAIGTAIGVLWIPAKFIWQFVKTKYAKVKSFLQNIESTSSKVGEIYPMVLKINEEMKPNGGSSLRDAINRLESRTAISELRLKLATKLHGEVSFETDRQGNYKWVSTEWEVVYGISSSDALEKGWVNGIYFEDREEVVEEWNKAVTDQRKFSLTYRANPDNPTWVLCEAHPFMVGGKVQGWIGFANRVTAPTNNHVS